MARFEFNLPEDMKKYLDWKAKQKNTSKSNIVRTAIQRLMIKDYLKVESRSDNLIETFK